jgi:hypothetical protein
LNLQPPADSARESQSLVGKEMQMKSHRILSAVFVALMLAVSTLSATACSSTDGNPPQQGNNGGSNSSGGY